MVKAVEVQGEARRISRCSRYEPDFSSGRRARSLLLLFDELDLIEDRPDLSYIVNSCSSQTINFGAAVVEALGGAATKSPVIFSHGAIWSTVHTLEYG